jgi:hypothetical protein
VAKVRDDGAVRVCTDATATGDDSLVVTITDTKHAGRALPLTIPIHLDDGTASAGCDVDAFETTDSGGCCDSGGHPGGAIPLAIGVLGLVLRRRGRGLSRAALG